MNSKTCSKCGVSKAIDLFPVKKSKCKDCIAEYMKEYFQKRKVELMANHKDWVSRNPQKHLRHQRTYRQKNSEIYKEAGRKWRAKNPEKVKEHKKRWEKSIRADVRVSYCKKILARQLGVSATSVPPHLSELKRDRIILLRLTKQLTNVIKEKLNGS